MLGSQDEDIDLWSTKLRLFVMGIGSAGMLLIKPVIVGGLIQNFGYQPHEAGLVAGIEMAGVGIGTLVAVLFGAAWNGRTIAMVGAAIGLAGSIGPSLWTEFPIVLAFRCAAGIGVGVMVSVVISALAITKDPDRTFSLYYMASAITAAGLFPTAAWLVGQFGVRAAYLFIAALLLPVFALRGAVPRRRGSHDTSRAGDEPFPFRWAAVSLSASVVYWVGTGAVWAFIERIGVAERLDEKLIGSILAASQLTFILGAFSASQLHTRLGRALPATAGVMLSVVALAVIHYATDSVGFAAGVMLYTFAWMFFFPYMTGTMAAQDAAGRIAVLGVPSQTLGLAIGPAVAGFLIHGADYSAVMLFGAAAYAASILIFLPALINTGRTALGPSELSAT